MYRRNNSIESSFSADSVLFDTLTGRHAYLVIWNTSPSYHGEKGVFFNSFFFMHAIYYADQFQ